MKRRIGDRRSKARFEIVGDLWGSLDAKATLTVRNLGSHGALLESPVALPPDSMHWVTAVIDGHAELLRVLVRYSVRNESGSTPGYLTGVEFVSVTPRPGVIRAQLSPQGRRRKEPDAYGIRRRRRGCVEPAAGPAFDGQARRVRLVDIRQAVRIAGRTCAGRNGWSAARALGSEPVEAAVESGVKNRDPYPVF